MGSFPGRQASQVLPLEQQWFYSASRNQFWIIMASVYNVQLLNRKDKEALFNRVGIGLTDILFKVHRTKDTNQDENLEIIEYNTEAIKKILNKGTIEQIFFTGKFVEKLFRQQFPEIKMGESLPSPSPRYASMSLAEKTKRYKEKLPPKK